MTNINGGSKRRYKCPDCGKKNYTCLNAPWEHPRKMYCNSCGEYFDSTQKGVRAI
jgi:transcription elongation factor Elf1